MKKNVLRKYLKERDEHGNKIVVIGDEKPEILPFYESGITNDEYGNIVEVRIKPKRTRKPKGEK